MTRTTSFAQRHAALWLIALSGPSLATAVTVTDPAGQAPAAVMVRERSADGPNLDTSDGGYPAPGVARTVAPEITRFTDAEGPEKDFTQEEVSVPKTEKSAPSVPSIPAEEHAVSENADRANKLQADLDAINAELRIIEDNESSIKASLEEKATSRQNWNPYQSRYLQQEAEPLQKELSMMQQRKSELLQRRAYIEGELQFLR